MTDNEFLQQVARMGEIGRGEWDGLRQAVEDYPYALHLRAMLLCADSMWDVASVDAPRKTKENLYLENFGSLTELLSRAKEYEEKEEAYDVMQEINSYQEVSFKTAPRSVILSHFLEENDFSPVDEDRQPTESLEDLGKKSNGLDGGLASETLAIVFAKQGKIDKAIEMYKKLMEQNPEKSSTFATRIQELEAQRG